MDESGLDTVSSLVDGRGKKGILDSVFRSCSDDPRGAVHRLWGISLLFVVIYFIIAVIETINLHSHGGGTVLMVATVWAGLVHLSLGVLGTFVLKRFPTSFSIGFLLGVLVILANQNLLLFSAYSKYEFGNPSANKAFAWIALALFFVLGIMAILLFHFKEDVVVVPVDLDGTMDTGVSTKQDDSYVTYEGKGGGRTAKA